MSPNDKWDVQDPLPKAKDLKPRNMWSTDNESHKPIILSDRDQGLQFDANGKRIRRTK